MGRVDCSRHGASGMILACPHIHEIIRQQTLLPKTVRLSFVDDQDTDERYRFHVALDYCLICASEKGLPPHDFVESDEKLDSYYNADHFRPACFSCFTELKGPPASV